MYGSGSGQRYDGSTHAYAALDPKVLSSGIKAAVGLTQVGVSLAQRKRAAADAQKRAARQKKQQKAAAAAARRAALLAPVDGPSVLPWIGGGLFALLLIGGGVFLYVRQQKRKGGARGKS